MTKASKYARWTLLILSAALLLATTACIHPHHGHGHHRVVKVHHQGHHDHCGPWGW